MNDDRLIEGILGTAQLHDIVLQIIYRSCIVQRGGVFT